MAQYGRRNNVVLSGIPDSVPDDIEIDIDVFVEHQEIEACHRFGKAGKQK